MSITLTPAEAAMQERTSERERIRCIYAAMPRRTDAQLEEILGNQKAEFHVRAAAADVKRARASSATPVIPAEFAQTEDELAKGYYEFPEATRIGVVCGQCSTSERDRTGDRKAQVRHASIALVRYCFDTRAAMDAETKAEMDAERRVELYYEGAFDMPSGEEVHEDARERWLASLQD